MEVKGKEHDGQPDEQEEELIIMEIFKTPTLRLLRGWSVPGLHAAQEKLWQRESLHDELRQAVRQAPHFRSDWLSIICRVFSETVTIFYNSVAVHPACGLACVNDVLSDWIRVCRFRAAHNEMRHVTVNCVSLTSTSMFRLQLFLEVLIEVLFCAVLNL